MTEVAVCLSSLSPASELVTAASNDFTIRFTWPNVPPTVTVEKDDAANASSTITFPGIKVAIIKYSCRAPLVPLLPTLVIQ